MGEDTANQTVFRLERPRIISYNKSDYNADIQNWSIAQDGNGIMYFANKDGLLSFDGSDWELFPHPERLIIRSVASGPDGRIYTGTYEDFGYWERDPYGNMVYHSLKPLVRDFDFHNQEIWKIIVSDESVYFQSFTYIFHYQNGVVEAIRAPGIVTCFTEIRDTLYARIVARGLYKFDNNRFALIDSSAFFREIMTRVILPGMDGQLLMATSAEGIYLYDGPGKIKPWNPGNPNLMKNQVINRGIVLSNGQLLFGTQLYGIHVFDTTGNLLFSMDQHNGLQNNTILALFEDDQGFIWAGLDNGIDLIDLKSRISFYRDTEGKIGAVYSLLFTDENVFAATNKGVFYSQRKREATKSTLHLDFTLLPGSESQAWFLESLDDQIFCGHNDGTFEIRDLNFEQVSPVAGGYSICRIRYSESPLLLQGTYTELVLYRKEEGKWVYGNRIAGLTQPIKYIESDHLGNIWAGHNTKGLYQIRLNGRMDSIERFTFYGAENGLPDDYGIGVFLVNNRVVFLSQGNFFTYDDLTDSIVPFTPLNDYLASERFHRIIPSEDNEYWFISESRLVLYRVFHDHLEKIASYPFDLFDNRQISSHENLRKLSSHQSILCLDNGFALLPHRDPNVQFSKRSPLLKKITATSDREEMELELPAQRREPLPVIPYRFNNIQFRFACPIYGTSLTYNIYLEGIDEDTSIITRPSYRYDRLPAGAYRLHLSASDGWGNQTGKTTWLFRIRSPWYWSIIARILYVFLLILTVTLITRYFMKRFRAQVIALKEEKENEIIKIRNEQLQSEVAFKSKELANTTFNIMKKNELMIEIRDALEREMRSASPDQRRSYRRIIRLVDRNISHEEDWKVFENNFERAHEEFLSRIRKKYNSLTPSDLRLCAYLRMNLSTKKIALLQGISVRGVENHRYRLRKKLNLQRDENLTNFLMNF